MNTGFTMFPPVWQRQQLGKVIEFKYGKSLPDRVRDGQGAPVYGSGGEIGRHSKTLTKGTTIIIGRKGSIGSIHLVLEPCHPIDTAYYIDEFGPFECNFLSYLLSVLGLGSMNRASAVPSLVREDVYALEIPIPPLPEQRRIVARIQEAMKRVDEIRRLREEAKKEADALFFSSLSEVIKKEWPVQPLSELTTDIRNGWSGKEEETAPVSHVLRLSSVHGLTINPEECREVHVRPVDLTAFGIKQNDVFVVRGNGSKHLVGRSAIAATDLPNVIFNDLLIRVTPIKNKLLPEFLNFCFHVPNVRRQIEEASKTAAGIWKINQGGLSKIKIPCPTIPEQVAVVYTALNLRNGCKQLQNEIDETGITALPSAILRKAFAGEL